MPSRLRQERKNLAVENNLKRFGAKRQRKKTFLPGQAGRPSHLNGYN